MQKWKMLGIIYNDCDWNVFYCYHGYYEYRVLYITGLNGLEIIDPNDIRVVYFSGSFEELSDGGKEYLRFKTISSMKWKLIVQDDDSSDVLGALWMNANPYHRNTADFIFSSLANCDVISYFSSFRDKHYFTPNNKEDIKEWLKELFSLDLDAHPTLSDFIGRHIYIFACPVAKQDIIDKKMLKKDIPGFLENLAYFPFFVKVEKFFPSESTKIETIQYIFDEIKREYANPVHSGYRGVIFKIYKRLFYFDYSQFKWFRLDEIK